ncbi:hypothetical protein FZEAL_5317 [Fusarium zealandicum]|uniref:Uncharacterized protein n=1 Tax=Fusarium zealandicum TaxID=1053134 RepID=A0A8H4XKQ7_9HYPO|nr:hypothetical protein FZEAL_5317 [Fusarium zealandicum]
MAVAYHFTAFGGIDRAGHRPRRQVSNEAKIGKTTPLRATRLLALSVDGSSLTPTSNASGPLVFSGSRGCVNVIYIHLLPSTIRLFFCIIPTNNKTRQAHTTNNNNYYYYYYCCCCCNNYKHLHINTTFIFIPSTTTAINMSILNSIKRARDHKEAAKPREVEKPKTTTATAQPYRHVPKHAACDSVASGPAGARRQDRSKVRAENRKRTAQAVAETHAVQMNFPGSATDSPFTSGTSSTTYQASEADYYGDISPRSRSPVQSFGFPAPPSRNFYDPSEPPFSYPSIKGKEVVRGPCYGMAYSVSPDKNSLPEHFQAALMI